MPIPAQPAAGTPKARSRDTVDALEFLRLDHVAVARLLEAYAAQKDRWRPDKKRLASDEICIALDRHDTLEEELFYPVCEQALPDLARLIAASRAEHELMRELIARIGESEPDGPAFDSLVDTLVLHLQRHVLAEEREIFPRLRESDVDLRALGARLVRRRDQLIAEEH